MYAKLLSVLSVHYILRPASHMILFDEEPPDTPEWQCACRLATCMPTSLKTHEFGRAIVSEVDATDRFASDKRGRCGNTQLDLLRIDTLLERGGGAFLDLDVFILRNRLDRCRRSTTIGSDAFGRLNPGVILAPPRAAFLRRWRHSFRDVDLTARDFGSRCNHTAELAAAANRETPSHPVVRAARELGPLPRYVRKSAYEAHIRHAPVAHLSAFRHEWRLRDVMRARLLERVWDRVSAAINATVAADPTDVACSDPIIAGCLQTIRGACWARPGGQCGIYGA